MAPSGTGASLSKVAVADTSLRDSDTLGCVGSVTWRTVGERISVSNPPLNDARVSPWAVAALLVFGPVVLAPPPAVAVAVLRWEDRGDP